MAWGDHSLLDIHTQRVDLQSLLVVVSKTSWRVRDGQANVLGTIIYQRPPEKKSNLLIQGSRKEGAWVLIADAPPRNRTAWTDLDLLCPDLVFSASKQIMRCLARSINGLAGWQNIAIPAIKHDPTMQFCCGTVIKNWSFEARWSKLS